MSPTAEQRKEARVTLHTPTILHWRSGEKDGSGTVSNMSRFGCYVLTQHPAAVGENLDIRLDGQIQGIGGQVRYVDPHVGMGVEFLVIKREAESQLVEFLRAKTAFPATP